MLMNDYHRLDPLQPYRTPFSTCRKSDWNLRFRFSPEFCDVSRLVCVYIYIYFVWFMMVSIRFVRLPCSTFGSQKSFGARDLDAQRVDLPRGQKWSRGWQCTCWMLGLKLPKTNIAPENRQSQKETIVFKPSIFMCQLLVSGRSLPRK